MMKKAKEKIQKLNLDPKKESIKYLIINLSYLIIFILLVIFAFSVNVLVFGILGLLATNYFFFYRYDIYLEDKRRKLEVEFVEMFSYLRIYIVNKENVYNSLKKSNQYTSISMRRQVDDLVTKIDEDKTIVPFLEFGKYFKNKIIEEVMISLFQMVDGGYQENYLNQFINIFESYKVRFNKELLINRYKKIDTINTMSLIGTGYLMMIILVVIFQVIGEISNV